MEDASPWSRLGFGSVSKNADQEELLLLRDQVMELSKAVASLTLRLEKVERVEEGPIDNVFGIADYKDFFGGPEDSNEEPIEVEPETIEEVEPVRKIKSGFTVTPLEEVEEVAVEEVEPIGRSEDIDSEEVPIEKEFVNEELLAEFVEREEKEIIEGVVEMVERYIDKNHGILNNQLKKKIYSDIPVNDKIKKGIKEALANHERIKAHKVDNFRTLYHKGEDGDEEYRRTFG